MPDYRRAFEGIPEKKALELAERERQYAAVKDMYAKESKRWADKYLREFLEKKEYIFYADGNLYFDPAICVDAMNRELVPHGLAARAGGEKGTIIEIYDPVEMTRKHEDRRRAERKKRNRGRIKRLARVVRWMSVCAVDCAFFMYAVLLAAGRMRFSGSLIVRLAPLLCYGILVGFSAPMPSLRMDAYAWKGFVAITAVLAALYSFCTLISPIGNFFVFLISAEICSTFVAGVLCVVRYKKANGKKRRKQ
ncbi:MAG: hypothetical protein LBL34_01920 [Clostridiales bacterium]|jgi:cation transport ATPase|nr:hypothetical protein [Clostridiales bacterium]